MTAGSLSPARRPAGKGSDGTARPRRRLIRAAAVFPWAFLLLVSRPLSGQPEESALRVPIGFRVHAYAESLAAPTALAFGASGELYVAVIGGIVVLRDRDGDGRADTSWAVPADLERPNGLTWRDGQLWVADGSRILRLDAGADTPVLAVEGLPGEPGPLRALLLEPWGPGLFVGGDPGCALCRDREAAAAVHRYDPAGMGVRWARGLGAVGGLAVHPRTGELWATVRHAAVLGDDLPPDEINVIRRGGDYGWPACYSARIPYPGLADRADCETSEPPVLLLPAGSSPLGLTFWIEASGAGRVEHLVVALGGSTGRSTAVGYRVVRVELEGGRPTAVSDLVTGWRRPGGHPWGRPVHPLVGPDGALYVSDDVSGRVWRVVRAADQGSSQGRGARQVKVVGRSRKE